jgi:5-methylcytosine-specific restriction endonuclease McrBC GTP-binding regulatory subunit McrB
LPKLGIKINSDNCIQTVFHPEYSYGDFIGKLMPLTEKGQVKYDYYEGHFLKALAQAYRNIMKAEEGQEPKSVALVIDEINRGNSAAIFGTAFQLLDRDRDGWSEYAAEVSSMEFNHLMGLIGVQVKGEETVNGQKVPIYRYLDKPGRYVGDDLNRLLEPLKIRRDQIRIPTNLSLVATMNTSDHSIFHMDSAFKRRWEWQYMDVDGTLTHESGEAFPDHATWAGFVQRLNRFIKDNHTFVRNVEDRLVGHRFINAENRAITYAEVQNKLLFFLWDSVFERSKEPLARVLNLEPREVSTFGDFARHVRDFVEEIKSRSA